MEKGLKRKSGFTLVELVVVIAILAVLAGIAIPAVISVINSATASRGATDGASMDQACKTYYMGIKTGTITKSTFDPKLSEDPVPEFIASPTMRLQIARTCTVAGALEYSGLYGIVNDIDQFGYDEVGNIFYIPGKEDKNEAGTPVTRFKLEDKGKVTFEDMHYSH